MPLVGSDSAFTVSVVDRRALNETVVLLRLRHTQEGENAFEWLPGQYIEVAAPSALDASHFYSIASARDPRVPGEFELVMSLSANPALLRELEPGRTLIVSRARGAFVWEATPGASLLVGIGTGVAPLRAILQAALEPSQGSVTAVTVLLGARTEATLLFRDELEQLARRDPRFRFEPVLSRASADWRGARGRVQEHLGRLVSERHPDCVYVCGTTTMGNNTVSLLHELGVAPSSVRAESHGE